MSTKLPSPELMGLFHHLKNRYHYLPTLNLPTIERIFYRQDIRISSPDEHY